MEDKDIISLIGSLSLKDERFTDEDLVWERIEKDIEQRRRRKLWSIWGTVASAAAAVCIVFVLSFNLKTSLEGGTAGHRYVLPDGSDVQVAAHSFVRYNRLAWGLSRRVALDGDASFQVTKHKGKFTVLADKGKVVVLGTQFSISQKNDNLHVACSEGVVAVPTAAGTRVLHKGEQLDYDGNRITVAPILPEYLEFDNASLSDVMKQVGQIYGLKVSTPDAFQGRLFSGWVATDNLDEALEVILNSCDLNYSLQDKVLTVEKK